jgi:hypothetical protein
MAEGVTEMVGQLAAGEFPEYEDAKYNNAAHLKTVGKHLLVDRLARLNQRLRIVDGTKKADSPDSISAATAASLESLTRLSQHMKIVDGSPNSTAIRAPAADWPSGIEESNNPDRVGKVPATPLEALNR